MIVTEFPVEHVLSFTALTRGDAVTIDGAPQGTRGVVDVTGGSFEGPRLRGTIGTPGGDWFTRRNSGVLKLDVRLLLVVDDGTNILLSYSGIAVNRDGRSTIRIAPLFEAPEGPHAWLNDIQCVGTGSRIDGGVTYDIYALL